MKPRRPAILGAALLCTALWAATPHATRAESPAAAAEQAREVLVMLRIAPDHLRPGSGYGKSYHDGQSRARLRTAREIAQRHKLELVGAGWPMHLLGIDCYVMRAPAGRTVEAVAAELSQDPAVAWSEPMRTYRTPGRGDGVTPPPMEAPALAT